MFNKLPKYVRIVSSYSVGKFKPQLDKHPRNIVNLPCQSGFNNSLDGGDCLNGGHYADNLAANLAIRCYRTTSNMLGKRIALWIGYGGRFVQESHITL